MRGAVQWMADNHVASNILMLVLVVGGLIIGKGIKQEVFPEFELDRISVTVAYPGASPAEVEDGIILPIENAVSGVDNIKRITATASESVGSVSIEIMEGADTDEVLNDVKSEVDRIRTFPEDAEKPNIAKVSNRREVMNLVVYGDVSERAIFEQAERIRDDLLGKPEITQCDLSAVRAEEISIEISEQTLRSYNLTLPRVANIIRSASLDIPGGSIKTEGGEILIRTKEKRYTGEDYGEVVALTQPTGEKVRLRDVATIDDGFSEAEMETSFDGKRAALVNIYRVGDQTPRSISKTVKGYLEELKTQLPSSIDIAIWMDRTEILQSRINLLFKNGLLGVILVLIILTLFLEIRLALWVAIGIVISFLGALIFMPGFDVSINMISLFGFLTVLGIVVDDAIIVGENIYVHYRSGKPLKQASIEGTWEISRAVVFAVLTSVVAFSPLLFAAGTMGKFMRVMPVIVISVLVMSLIESLFILPSHISSKLTESKAKIWSDIEKKRSKFDRFVNWLINKTYEGTLQWVSRNRYITVAIAIASLLITLGFFTGGFIKFVFMPRIDADWIRASLNMVPGTPYDETKMVAERIRAVGVDLIKEYEANRTDGKSDFEHTFVMTGSQRFGSHGLGTTVRSSSTHLAMVNMRFVGADERQINLMEFAREWRKRIGPIPNLESLRMRAELMGSGIDIDIQLAHDEYKSLLQAVERVKSSLENYAGVEEVSDNYSEGKKELKITLKPEAKSLGVTESDLGMQVRSAFYGAEALRLQRGKNEVRVMVRYPEEERRNVSSLNNMRLRTASGGVIPFEQAAYVEETRGYNAINRADRKRVINVMARINQRQTNSDEILSDLTLNVLDRLVQEYPGLTYDLEGENRDRRESMGSLGRGFLFALFVIYALLAIPFKSFLQPFAVMSAIPFGIVGAIIGHLILGYNLSLISAFGIVALSGVVVNDSLVMIDFINRRKEEGYPLRDAVIESGKRRFRPIILTSLTTFFGLSPMMLETSIQARFLVPMAISLGFGVLFATAITLILIPALYLIIEDLKKLFGAA